MATSTESGLPGRQTRSHDDAVERGGSPAVAARLRAMVRDTLADFPWPVRFSDWTGESVEIRGSEAHWSGGPLHIRVHSEAAARRLVRYDIMGFLEKYLEGAVDLEGNLYLLSDVRRFARFRLKALQAIPHMLVSGAFQNASRASVNVKSHYDIPQEALNVYLDRVYMSYSCGIFEHPDRLDLDDMLTVGRGREDDFDSLEKAQWRKFQDAVDFIAPREGESLLDVGCGYGGQLQVALESQPFGKVVGWTHSANQAHEGQRLLAGFEQNRWELNEGDYRQDERVFDHITSTGMVSHVGPRGLVPYVRKVRRRIKSGGRYLHHALMTPYNRAPLDLQLGPAFHKKYVWPGFHWFTVGQHVRALEKNGFQVQRMTNLSRHYAKTTAAWYERMMSRRKEMVENLGEPTVRAWQVFLAGITGAYLNRGVHVYRLYCDAV
jgi:cyclopropane-fatty-acyl-phospholipid synthase